MNVTTKELRIQPGRILDQVADGEEVIVTYRGRPMARIVPVQALGSEQDSAAESIFGMWSSHDSNEKVEDLLREMRQGRQF